MGRRWCSNPSRGPLAPGRWEFDPGGRAAGPWMILGRDGDWNRMRPLLWEVPGKEDQILLERFQPKAGGALATAVCISNPDDRARALDELLVALADDCGHEDWHQIYAFLHRFRGLPREHIGCDGANDRCPARCDCRAFGRPGCRDVLFGVVSPRGASVPVVLAPRGIMGVGGTELRVFPA